LISATCDRLNDLVESKKFRQDLYYRLIGFNIYLNPIRERRNDIANLIKQMIRNGERRFVIDPLAFNILVNYNWPGNIREIAKTIDVFQTFDKGIIEVEDVINFISPENLETKKNSSGPIDLEEIKKVGLNAYLERIEMDVVSKVLSQNNEKVRKTLSDLKLSNNSFYRIMDNIKVSDIKHVQ
jgi:transcriptional regulator with PAS, ATPase and Fis domain